VKVLLAIKSNLLFSSATLSSQQLQKDPQHGKLINPAEMVTPSLWAVQRIVSVLASHNFCESDKLHSILEVNVKWSEPWLFFSCEQKNGFGCERCTRNYMVTRVTAECFNYHHVTTLGSAQPAAVCWKECGVWSVMIH